MSCLLPEEEESFGKLDQFVLYVPSIFYIECLSVINNALKRRRIDKNFADQYLDILQAMTIRIDNFSSTPEAISILNRITQEKSLTSYDASYFELATRLNTSLATKDTGLIQACQKSGIPLF
jgi:predicted nucleic acid-binding protein